LSMIITDRRYTEAAAKVIKDRGLKRVSAVVYA